VGTRKNVVKLRDMHSHLESGNEKKAYPLMTKQIIKTSKEGCVKDKSSKKYGKDIDYDNLPEEYEHFILSLH
jgi:hypothetical protein